MSQQKQRIEFLTNGITITNQLTGEKEASYNQAKVTQNASQFITEQMQGAEPGVYYDIHIVVTKQRNKSPKA